MRLLIVEGRDEVNFFSKLIEYLGITDVYIENVKGKDKFKQEITALLISHKYADNLTKLAVVIDADSDANAAFQKIKNILEGLDIRTPLRKNEFKLGAPACGIFVMPGDFSEGMLEDLCMNIAFNREKVTAAREYIQLVSEMAEPPINKSKAVALAFLASMPDGVSSVGYGAFKGYWDFNCNEIKDLTTFLLNLA